MTAGMISSQWCYNGPESITDWLNEEKFIDMPMFDDIMTNTIPNHLEMKSVEYDKFVPSNKDLPYQPYNSQQFTPIYCPQTNMQTKFNYIPPPSLTPPTSLTPPESPKDTDVLMSMLDDMQPEELTQLVVDDDTLSDFMSSSDTSSYTDSYSEFVPTKRIRPSSVSTPTEEKRQRKKEQNKNAATRYRMKKKAEIKESVMEEKELVQKNDNLKEEAKELAREIKYLKSLLRDVYKAKGLLD
ncbi:activating transcription factor of chaperone isoform X2 [Daktulosphaira vitifoliae]|uniref:activating transcription factor of chaperone isoform X2 n=1 Tax=Daktulosphaira vitifoliae TaxID=58002 RepID=UPI0021AAC51E|nr:activating transcription factor of chaperone isoform X2 [Daktulosphaira vitifoliae]